MIGRRRRHRPCGAPGSIQQVYRMIGIGMAGLNTRSASLKTTALSQGQHRLRDRSVISDRKQGENHCARTDVAAQFDGKEIAICWRHEWHSKSPCRNAERISNQLDVYNHGQIFSCGPVASGAARESPLKFLFQTGKRSWRRREKKPAPDEGNPTCGAPVVHFL